MQLLLAFFTALVISVSVIPLLIRAAPRLRLVDRPDPRKIHRVPMPRVGGIGIVAGALVPLALLTPLDASVLAYLAGAATLLAFGLWDDVGGLEPSVKFLGQILAVTPAVFFADIYVAHLPLLGLDALPVWFGKCFTVVVMVGVINAVNTSDGLDGLAGGLSLLTLAAIVFLSYQADGMVPAAIAASAAGGVLGFLRYNTYPAGTFMGDSGSQFLGFSLGYLVIVLTQDVSPALSPALPALLLGLPVADLIYVMAKRRAHGVSCFRADKNHLHHRLLDVGFDHYEAVVVIYAVQVLFVLAAMQLRFETDALILALYLGVCLSFFGAIIVARRGGWRAHRVGEVSRLSLLLQAARHNGLLTTVPVRVVAVGLSALLLAVSVLSNDVPRDVGAGALLLVAAMLVYLLRSDVPGLLTPRTVAYVTSAFVVYLETRNIDFNLPWFPTVEVIYFAVLALAIALAARFSATGEFKPNPLDFLVIAVVFGLGLLVRGQVDTAGISLMAVKLVILFYGCELILAHIRTRWNPLNLSAIVTLSVLGVRAFV